MYLIIRPEARFLSFPKLPFLYPSAAIYRSAVAFKPTHTDGPGRQWSLMREVYI